METTKMSGYSPRQFDGPCFCTSLDRIVADLPVTERAMIESAITAFLQSPAASDDGRSDWQYLLEEALVKLAKSSSLFCGQLLRLLATPVLADCNPRIYAAVACAVAFALPPEQSSKVVNALRNNLTMCGETLYALCFLASTVPEAVLSLLHDALGDDSTIAVKIYDVLREIHPSGSVVEQWLDSSVPGLRAAMLFYLAVSGRSPKRFSAAMEEAMDDPDPNYRAVAVQGVFRAGRSWVPELHSRFIFAAFDDPDPQVRSAAGKGLLDHPNWTGAHLSELTDTLLNHGDDGVRVLIARAIGHVQSRGVPAISALSTIVARKGNAEVRKAAREALAMTYPRKVNKVKVI